MSPLLYGVPGSCISMPWDRVLATLTPPKRVAASCERFGESSVDALWWTVVVIERLRRLR
jgi:hypothetical protein